MSSSSSSSSLWVVLVCGLLWSQGEGATTPLTVDCDHADSVSVCHGDFCQQSLDLELKVSLCPHFCGFCGLNSDVNCAIPDRQGVCEGDVCQQLDQDVTKALCPHVCGFCNTSSTATSPATTTASTRQSSCQDHVINGQTCADLPQVCNDPDGRHICPRYCGLCGPTQSSEHRCKDHIVRHLTCRALPSICRDSYASRLCPKFCFDCHDNQQSVSTTVNPTCIDHLVDGRHCSDLPGFCGQDLGKKVCPAFCRTCTGPSVAYPTGSTPPQGACVDYVGNGLSCHDVPGVCSDVIGRKLLCPKYCGDCGPATPMPTTTAATTPPPLVFSDCRDYLLYDYTCLQMTDICNGKFNIACRRSCNQCTTSPNPGGSTMLPSPSGGCYDRVGGDVTCAHLTGICSDHLAPLLCPAFCGICKVPTTTPAWTSTPGTCEDHLDQSGTGLSCLDTHNQPAYCDRPYGYLICPKTCNLCNYTPPAPTLPASILDDCVDHVGHNMDCAELAQDGFCSNIFSKIVCRDTCGHCRVTTQSSTATSTSPPLPTTGKTGAATSTTTVGATARPTISGPCMDKVKAPETCADLDGQVGGILCQQPEGLISCPLYCKVCECKPMENPSCQDDADQDVCGVYGFCSDIYARVVCQRTCGVCDAGCKDHLESSAGVNCTDWIGQGRPMPDLQTLCADPLGSVVCQKTCGCLGYCQP